MRQRTRTCAQRRRPRALSVQRKLRAAVVGCGRIGCEFDDDPRRTAVATHAGAYTRSEAFELVAVADLEPRRLVACAKRFGISGRYRDHRELLDRERPDVVSVCTPSETHGRVVADAVSAGARAVFCEKPIADTLAAADEMIRICEDAGALLLVDHQRRFDRLHRAAAAFVHGGGLGPVRQATSYYTAGVANTGTHLFDLLRLFLGEAEWVEAHLPAWERHDARDPTLEARIGFEAGTVASVHALDVTDYTIFETNLLGTKGRLRILDHGFRATFEVAAPSEQFGGYRALSLPEERFGNGRQPEFMLQAVEHLRACLDGAVEPLSTGRDGRAALEIVGAARESADVGRRINLRGKAPEASVTR